MKKIDPSIAAALAAFKGKVTRVETGASSGITDRQWYAASQGRLDLNAKLRGEAVTVELTEHQAERERERFAEARHFGASQDLAHRYATGQIDCLCCGDIKEEI